VTTLKLPKPVLDALNALGVLEDELLAVVNEAESKDPAFADGGEAVKSWIQEKVSAHIGLDAASALAASVTAQILGKKFGYDPDHGMDS
jgi:hypothetical protein